MAVRVLLVRATEDVSDGVAVGETRERREVAGSKHRHQAVDRGLGTASRRRGSKSRRTPRPPGGLPPRRRRLSSMPTTAMADYRDGIGFGKPVAVDLAELLVTIVPSPFAPPWFTPLLDSVLKRYDISVSVTPSEILAEPFF
jgi:hypothetical protein